MPNHFVYWFFSECLERIVLRTFSSLDEAKTQAAIDVSQHSYEGITDIKIEMLSGCCWLIRA